jgi:hypothetical protein
LVVSPPAPAGEDEVDVSSEAPGEPAGETSLTDPVGCAPPIGETADSLVEPTIAAAAHATWRGGLMAIVKRYGDPIALAVVAILYLFWPSGLAPDRKWYGGADDVVFIVLLAYLARRVIRRSPALLDLPGAVSRAVRSALRRSA